LVPSQPLVEPGFPKRNNETVGSPAPAAAAGPEKVRPAILDLKPAGDPIYLVDEPRPDAGHDQWRTYRRPNVERFSRDGEGLAIQGYDVISYLSGHAEKGLKELSIEQDGTTWLFAAAGNHRLFAKDPRRYLPAYGGFCAYSIAKGYPATADPRVFTTAGGRLYLFFDQAVKTVWEQDHNRFIGKADQNWPRLHR
jgi:hypothetical protein